MKLFVTLILFTTCILHQGIASAREDGRPLKMRAKFVNPSRMDIGREIEKGKSPVALSPTARQHQWCITPTNCGPVYDGDCPLTVNNPHGLTCNTWQ